MRKCFLHCGQFIVDGDAQRLKRLRRRVQLVSSSGRGLLNHSDQLSGRMKRSARQDRFGDGWRPSVQIRFCTRQILGIDVRGQSVDIPFGAKHRLENFGSDQVEIIEVQFGDYLGEDDIIRYEDVYQRS